MNVLNSKIGAFALKSYVSVLDDTHKATTLRIVGGDLPVINRNDPDWKEKVEAILDESGLSECPAWTVPFDENDNVDWDHIGCGWGAGPGVPVENHPPESSPAAAPPTSDIGDKPTGYFA